MINILKLIVPNLDELFSGDSEISLFDNAIVIVELLLQVRAVETGTRVEDLNVSTLGPWSGTFHILVFNNVFLGALHYYTDYFAKV